MDKSHTIDKDLIQGLTQKEVEVDHLQNVIIALSTKIHTINDIEREQTRSRQLASENDSAREHLQVTIRESATMTVQRAKENKEYQDNLGRENNQLRKDLDTHSQTIGERNNTISDQGESIVQNNRRITEINMRLADLTEMKSINENLNKQINESERR